MIPVTGRVSLSSDRSDKKPSEQAKKNFQRNYGDELRKNKNRISGQMFYPIVPPSSVCAGC